MHWKELAGQLWKSHRSPLILLGILLIINLALFAALEQFVTPRVAEQESTFLKVLLDDPRWCADGVLN